VDVTMRINAFWNVTPCSLVDINICEEEACVLRLYPEDGGSKFLRSVSTYLPNYRCHTRETQ
jgi:hypothetical protein